MKKKLAIAAVGLFIIIVSGIVTYAALSYFNPFYSKDKICSSHNGIEICLSADRHETTSYDIATYTVTLRNLTIQPYTQTFSSTCTEPTVAINETSPALICGAAITDHTLAPFGVQTFTISHSGADYSVGDNTAYASWGTHKSPSLTITKSQSSQTDIGDQFKECQSLKDDLAYNTIPRYCRSITVILADKIADCKAFKAILASIDLTVPCDNVMSIGVGYVYVPKEDTTDWNTKIQTLSGIESVN